MKYFREEMELIVWVILVAFYALIVTFKPGCDYIDVSTEVTTCTQIRIERCSPMSSEYSANGAFIFDQTSGFVTEEESYLVTYQREDNGQMNTLMLSALTKVCPIRSDEKPYIEVITRTPCDGGYNHNKHYLLHSQARITIIVYVPQDVIEKLFQ